MIKRGLKDASKFFFYSEKLKEWNFHYLQNRNIGKKHILGEEKGLHFGYANLKMPSDVKVEVGGQIHA